MFTGVFKKKKSHGAETGSQVAAADLFLYQTFQVSGKDACIREKTSFLCHFQDDLFTASELSGSSDSLTKNNNNKVFYFIVTVSFLGIFYCFYQSVYQHLIEQGVHPPSNHSQTGAELSSAPETLVLVRLNASCHVVLVKLVSG